jgi:hypothetical protein
MEILNLKSSGIICRTDVGLYNENNTAYFLSVYGSPQQVKGIFSSLATGRDVQLLQGKDTLVDVLKRDYSDTLRFKGGKIGYGKQYGIIWSESIGEDVVFWMSKSDRLNVLSHTLNKRKIPYVKDWLPKMETVLQNEGYLTGIKGYGGCGGYICEWDDDAICDLLVELFMKEQVKLAT